MSTPDSFIEEVTEEVRRDRLFRLFRKYGWIGIVLVVAVVAGTGFNEWRKTIGCRVSPPAVEGRANRAVLLLVAEKLGVPAASVSILSGTSASRKQVLVAGIAKQEILARLDRLQ